jgi:hypothetical protein
MGVTGSATKIRRVKKTGRMSIRRHSDFRSLGPRNLAKLSEMSHKLKTSKPSMLLLQKMRIAILMLRSSVYVDWETGYSRTT